jgi:DNA-binding MarR family transcriptional regulator
MTKQENTVYEIITNLKKVQQATKQKMHNHFKCMDLTAPQGMLIMIIVGHGDMKISEISKKMGLSNSTVSGIIDRLEVSGYVIRERSEEDRRIVHVKITKTMKEKLKLNDDIISQIMSDALTEATDQELETVRSGLNILNNLLKKTKEGECNG